MFRIDTSKEAKSKLVATKGCREEEIGSECLMGTGFPFGVIKNVMELDNGDGCASS